MTTLVLIGLRRGATIMAGEREDVLAVSYDKDALREFAREEAGDEYHDFKYAEVPYLDPEGAS